MLAAAAALISAPQTATAVDVPAVVLGNVSVTGLSSETATLNATINPNGLPVSAHYECGLNGVFNLTTPVISIGSGFGDVPITAELANLLAGTPYECRLVATTPLGTVTGGAVSFQTHPLSVDPATGLPLPGSSSPSPSLTPLTRRAVKCTITGTNKADVLRGTSKADIVCGLGGNDKIRGLGGRDFIVGGAGNDRVFGGKGNDRIYGNAGKDRLSGNAGKDRIYAGSGNDRVFVADKRRGDYVSGGRGRDRAVVNRGDRVKSVERVVRR